jgi:predicted nucleic acid-binding protein
MSDGHAAALVLDSQGLSEAARGAPVVRELVRNARSEGAPVVVSAVTLAEVLRGHPRDAAVHLLLGGCRVDSVSPQIGRSAGELLGRTGRKDTVDAVVIATASMLPGPVLVLTSDPGDLTALSAGVPGISVRAV